MAITVIRVSRSSGCNEWTKPQKEPPIGRMGSLTHCWFRKFGWTHIFFHIANASCLLCTTYRAHQKCWYDPRIWSTYSGYGTRNDGYGHQQRWSSPESKKSAIPVHILCSPPFTDAHVPGAYWGIHVNLLILQHYSCYNNHTHMITPYIRS